MSQINPQAPEAEAAAIARIVHQSVDRTVSQSKVDEALNGSGILVFQDKNVLDLREYLPLPVRKAASVRLVECASFVEYVNAHKIEGQTHIFGQIDTNGGRFTATIDYHHIGATGVAARRAHTASLALEFTPQWKTWVGKNRLEMGPEEFSEFIRDNAVDIVSPDAGTLADMCLNLEANKSVSYRSVRNLKTGGIKLEYDENVEMRGGPANVARNSMDVPDSFTLGIVPFVGAHGVSQECKLRFRLRGSDLKFFFVLDAPHKNIEYVTQYARNEIEEKTGLKVYLGSA